MKRRFLISTIICCIITMCALSAYANKGVTVKFEYSQPAEKFNLYMDGNIICTDTVVGTMDCNDVVIEYGVHQFTMTAVSNGLETLHSPPYVWSYSPIQGAGPTFLNFNITLEDGSVIPIGAVKIE